VDEVLDAHLELLSVVICTIIWSVCYGWIEANAIGPFQVLYFAAKYLKKGGSKTGRIQVLVSRANKHLPAIRDDMELLERLLSRYNGVKKR